MLFLRYGWNLASYGHLTCTQQLLPLGNHTTWSRGPVLHVLVDERGANAAVGPDGLAAVDTCWGDDDYALVKERIEPLTAALLTALVGTDFIKVRARLPTSYASSGPALEYLPSAVCAVSAGVERCL